MAFAAAAIGVIGTAIKEASSYQTALAKVQNAAHLTAAETKAMGQTIMTASIGTTASANQMAAALGPVAGEIETVRSRRDATLLPARGEIAAHNQSGQSLPLEGKGLTASDRREA